MSRHEQIDGAAPAETYQRLGLALPKRDSCVLKINMSKHGHHVGEALAETYQHQGQTKTSCIHQIIYHIFSKNAQHEIYHTYGLPLHQQAVTQAPTTGWWSGPTCCEHVSGGTCCKHGANPGGTSITLGTSGEEDEPYHRNHCTYP